MDNYFIEIRILGPMKRDIKSLTYDVRKKCNLRGPKPVPHISIVYNPTPSRGRRDEMKLISDFTSICSKYPLMEFQFDGFGHFDISPDNGVAMINIIPSQQILDLRWELICQLGKFCALDPKFDSSRNYYSPHATIAMKLNQYQLNRVMGHLNGLAQPRKHYYLARATLLKNRRILSEYDFALRRALNRRDALNKRILGRTEAKIRRTINDNMRTATPRRLRIVFSPLETLKRALRKLINLFR